MRMTAIRMMAIRRTQEILYARPGYPCMIYCMQDLEICARFIVCKDARFCMKYFIPRYKILHEIFYTKM